MTEESLYLRGLAGRIAEAYAERTRPGAIRLAGSAARDDSDDYSGVDLPTYYPARPDRY